MDSQYQPKMYNPNNQHKMASKLSVTNIEDGNFIAEVHPDVSNLKNYIPQNYNSNGPLTNHQK
jgi:hypothetical protein